LDAGAQICLPGDEQRHEGRGNPSFNQFIFVEPSRLEEIIGGPYAADAFAFFRGRPAPSPFVTNIMSALSQDLITGCPGGALIGDSLITALVSWLANSSGVSTKSGRRSKLSMAEVARLVEYIDSGLGQSISLDELAALVSLSPRHFRRALNATTGQSPYQLVLTRRLERAKHLIDHNKYGLAEIAAAVGFVDQSHLTKMFQRAFGITPSVYRAQAGTRSTDPTIDE
jgi:AraC-like DNA-binding protein